MKGSVKLSRPVRKMSKEDLEYLDKSYRIVQGLLGVDTPLSPYYVLKMKGLEVGQHVMNYNADMMGGFEWEIIYLTFEYIRMTRENYFNNTTFNDISHKFNTIMMFVGKEIPTIYKKFQDRKNARQIKERNKEELVVDENKAEYTRKAEDNKNSRLNDLW